MVKLERGKTYHTHTLIFTVIDKVFAGRPHSLGVIYKYKRDAPNYKEFLACVDPILKDGEFDYFLEDNILGEYKEPRSKTRELYLIDHQGKLDIWLYCPQGSYGPTIVGKKTITITEGEGMDE